jgi:hypothetical protein
MSNKRALARSNLRAVAKWQFSTPSLAVAFAANFAREEGRENWTGAPVMTPPPEGDERP